MDETPDTTEAIEISDPMLTLTKSDVADKVVLSLIGFATICVATIAYEHGRKILKARKAQKGIEYIDIPAD